MSLKKQGVCGGVKYIHSCIVLHVMLQVSAFFFKSNYIVRKKFMGVSVNSLRSYDWFRLKAPSLAFNNRRKSCCSFVVEMVSDIPSLFVGTHNTICAQTLHIP